MELFSQRMGIKPVKSAIQVDSMDDDLRISLWNALIKYYWDKSELNYKEYKKDKLVELLWTDYFKLPLDDIKYKNWYDIFELIRNYFFKCQWNEVYDFIEFIANNYPNKQNNSKFMEFCNSILERELSAYRFVEGKITPITSELEISEIEKALDTSDSLKTVKTHLKRALELLSDRESPDYRNSIKESISAVEAICKLITNNEKATLGQTLDQIGNKVDLHPALKKAFDSLYGYTNDAEGIRHALLEESHLSFEDAKFMLVSCSAFINYLINKASKAGIEI